MDNVYTITYEKLVILGLTYGIVRGTPIKFAIGTLENLFNCKITSAMDVHYAKYTNPPINLTFETPEEKTKFMLKYL